jgi:hypothetical protein
VSSLVSHGVRLAALSEDADMRIGLRCPLAEERTESERSDS